MGICLFDAPDDKDWSEVKCRALITVYGNDPHLGVKPPDSDWRHRILAARHSPIRYLRYSFLFEDIPSNTAVHFCRHVHAQPYCSSLRNDRQCKIDGDAARRDTPINMILDFSYILYIPIVLLKKLLHYHSNILRLYSPSLIFVLTMPM